MRLWTIQPLEVVDIIEKKGVFTCDTAKSSYYNDFRDAYLWIVSEMDKRNIIHPDNIILPLWAWHMRDWKHKKPDLRTKGLGVPKEKYACIEFEIPDNQVLLSDYEKWHYVLNDAWYDDSTCEQEFDESHDWFDTLSDSQKKELTVASWQKIFDISAKRTEWDCNGRYIQATFWKLTADMVRDIKYFTAH